MELKKCKKCGYPVEVIKCLLRYKYAVGCTGFVTCPNSVNIVDKELDTIEEAVKWWNDLQESE